VTALFINFGRNYKTFALRLLLNNLKKISLYQFRNYNTASFSFDKRICCISGPNGSGKTNLLDAAYYLCYTKSYFTSQQQLIATSGTDGFRLEGIFYNGEKDEVISCKWRAGKKEAQADGVDYVKINDHIGKYSAVMIAPDDIELINGAGEQRRKWVDSILSQVDRAYLENLLLYQNVLLQRNAWLKLRGNDANPAINELEYYDFQMAKAGDYIFNARKTFLAGFIGEPGLIYSRLAGSREQIDISYQSQLFQGGMAELLRQSIQADLRYQRTLKGIHRDDFDFHLTGLPLKLHGSQGQKKSFLFSLKLAQYKYITTVQHHKPILLLDDVFEKLDQNRMEALLEIICHKDFGQVLLTDTHPERVIAAFGNSTDLSFIHLKH